MYLSALVQSPSNTDGSFPPTFMSAAWGISCCSCCNAGPCGGNPPPPPPLPPPLPPPPPPPLRVVRVAVKRAWILAGDTWFTAGGAACVDIAVCVMVDVVVIVGSWVSEDIFGLLVVDRTTGEFQIVLFIRVVQSCHLLVCLFIYRHFTAKLAISEYDRCHLFVIYYAYLILTYC